MCFFLYNKDIIILDEVWAPPLYPLQFMEIWT